METSDLLQIVRLGVEVTVGGILVWLVVSLKSNWSAHKNLLEERIELLKAQMPAAQELAAKVEIHKELLEAQKTELGRQLAQKDEAHRQELEQKLADIMALQEQIEKYEEAEQRRQMAATEVERYARNILAHTLTEQLHRQAVIEGIRRWREMDLHDPEEADISGNQD